MKVHYKKSVLDLVVEEIEKAQKIGKEIDFIELSDAEMTRLRREMSACLFATTKRGNPGEVEVMGVTVCKESPLRGYGMEEF